MATKKKNPAEFMRKKCVDLAKKIVKIKAGWKCAYCGTYRQKNLHGSHIYSEGVYKSMSADVDNILPLCAAHHMAASAWNRAAKWSWHGTPVEAMEWFMENYSERYDILKARSRKTQQADLSFWEDKYKQLKQEYDKIY